LVGPFQKGRGGPGGWWILDEPELHLHADILVPDLAGWHKQRLPELPQSPYFDLAPDWVCEILSPSTAREDRVEKMPIYAREGVAHIWLVDPDLRILEAFELRDGQWVLLGAFEEDNLVSVAPFDAITFNLSVLWA
jgi:Uma2 family endonuclease